MPNNSGSLPRHLAMLPSAPRAHLQKRIGWRNWRSARHKITLRHPIGYALGMDVVALTRQLVDIESISGNEARVADFLYRQLCALGYQTTKLPVEGDRVNVWAASPEEPHPAVVLSTHMDTVPPFIPSS